MIDESKPACPLCEKQLGVRRILYGKPHIVDGKVDVDENIYYLGGCMVSHNDPKWMCIDCRKPFGYPKKRTNWFRSRR